MVNGGEEAAKGGRGCEGMADGRVETKVRGTPVRYPGFKLFFKAITETLNFGITNCL